jgi:hypothetical protein
MPLVFAPCGTRLVSGPQANPSTGAPAFYFWSPVGAQWQNQVAAPPPLPQAFLAALAVAWAPPEHGSILGAVCLLGAAAGAPASFALLLWQEVEGAWEALAQLPLGAAGEGAAAAAAAAAAAGCLAFAPCHLGLRLACSAGSGGLVRVFHAADAARLGEWELCEDFSAAPPGSSGSSSSDGGSAASPAAPPVTSLCWCPSACDAPLLAVACGGQARVWGLARSASAAAAAAAAGSGGSGGGQWVAMLELQSSSGGSATGSSGGSSGAGLAAAVVAWAPSPGRAEHCLATGSASGELVFWRVAASGSPSARAMGGGGAGEGRRARAAAGCGIAGAVQSAHQGRPALRSLQFNAAGTTLAAHSVDPGSGEGSVALYRQALGGGWERSGHFE